MGEGPPEEQRHEEFKHAALPKMIWPWKILLPGYPKADLCIFRERCQVCNVNKCPDIFTSSLKKPSPFRQQSPKVMCNTNNCLNIKLRITSAILHKIRTHLTQIQVRAVDTGLRKIYRRKHKIEKV